MENLKIKVNNEVESKEAKELFVALGAVCCSGLERSKNVNFLFMNSGFVTACKLQENFDKSKCKEITLGELRDMVVLKRNDVGDATHTDGHCSFYVGKDKNYFFSSCYKAWRDTWKNVDILKPIEKNMKEYLDPRNGYKLIKAPESEALEPHASEWIPLPEGADIFARARGGFLFYAKTGELVTPYRFMYLNDSRWSKTATNPRSSDGFVDEILWQRHTQPEELPFIDDEPSLNDQYAEIEQVRQEAQAWANRPVGRCRTVPIDEAGLPDFLFTDAVNHPSHYASGEIECIDAIESSMTHEAFCGYLKGNVQKYMWRYENKGGLESLEKAQWYLNKLISRIS